MPPTENDGTLEIPIEETVSNESEVKPMAEQIDLPPNVATHLQMEALNNYSANTREGRDNASHASSLARYVATSKYAELGPVESRAISGVMATPVASPAVQSGTTP